MKILLSLIILFIPISILAKQICIAPSGCRIEQDTGFCPKCIDVKEEPPIIKEEKVMVEKKPVVKVSDPPLYPRVNESLGKSSKKKYRNEKGVMMCFFPELGWLDLNTNKPLGRWRDCGWRERGNRTADAIERGIKECGGYMNWIWTDEHHSKYRCNSRPKVSYTGCTWRCVVEPCSDDMLPDGCRWVGR